MLTEQEYELAVAVAKKVILGVFEEHVAAARDDDSAAERLDIFREAAREAWDGIVGDTWTVCSGDPMAAFSSGLTLGLDAGRLIDRVAGAFVPSDEGDTAVTIVVNNTALDADSPAVEDECSKEYGSPGTEGPVGSVGALGTVGPAGGSEYASRLVPGGALASCGPLTPRPFG